MVAVIAVAILVTTCVIFANYIIAYLELPVVELNATGQCARVVNFKNGDAYACQDKDVVLRRYKISIPKVP